MMDPRGLDETTGELSDALAQTSIEPVGPNDLSGGGAQGCTAAAVVRPHPGSLPVTRTMSCAVSLGGGEEIPTSILLQVFDDRVVFCVSQVGDGRVGHWFLGDCRPDPAAAGGSRRELAATPLLGAQRDGPDATEGLVYVRQLCQELALLQSSPPPPSSSAAAPWTEAAAMGAPTLSSMAAYPTVVLGMSLHPSAKGRPEAFRSLIQVLVGFYQETVSTASAD